MVVVAIEEWIQKEGEENMKIIEEGKTIEIMEIIKEEEEEEILEVIETEILEEKILEIIEKGISEEEIMEVIEIEILEEVILEVIEIGILEGEILEAIETLIANGRKSNNANMVAQSYSNYIAWKDSANALKHADEINALKQQIADNEAAISEKDSSLTLRSAIIIGLCVLAGALAAALVVGGVVLMRFILLTRKQKKTIKMAQDSDALKAKFISNISAQLEPTLQKLDGRIPEVKALLDFSNRIQTLSELQNNADTELELEEVQIQQFCENLKEEVRDRLKSNVTLTVNAPKMNVNINKEYVSHILMHLLTNAAEYTPAGGNIWLDFKKRSPHKYQFMVSDTGCGIPEEKHDDVFKPFLEIRDLTTGDGLGLPICKQMAQNMNGDLAIDPQFTKGARFVLDLNV